MKLPKLFDQAKNPRLCGGYRIRFKYPQCPKCSYLVKAGNHEGCQVKGYPLPFRGQTHRPCPDFEE
ncbi:MAG: hypothetical protein D5R97_04830 [Candidatus Syntrophonatronum acetioxidans]|uniref:Uncharacterized protein n=1 Tax=Candidatus Syntrophonatronum acetioxidans TaxID=1795816 RepID=A0A424YER1_9FIRM|nr:MAG: hypothetical protein D5R97_04830 [Candidatus Syntrophonatronum acetioxidans]